jgi:hypothetical protein
VATALGGGCGAATRRAEAEAAARFEKRWCRRMKRMARGREKKETPGFQILPIFVGVALFPIYSSVAPCHRRNMPLIFVGDMARPTNIWGQSKSNRMTHIFVSVQAKPMNIILYSWFQNNII